jgi:tRNA A-37 threonylcarbamoyl transferase component Bud32
MHLDISADEAEVLANVLESALGDLREEIYKAEVAGYKANLKAREAIITRLLEAVRARPVSS